MMMLMLSPGSEESDYNNNRNNTLIKKQKMFYQKFNSDCKRQFRGIGVTMVRHFAQFEIRSI